MRSSDQASAVAANPPLVIVARSRYIVPKERRIERLPSGYSVQEARNDSQGRYWFVVTAFEVLWGNQEILLQSQLTKKRA